MYIKSYDGYYHSDSFNISLYDGYSWSDTTTVDIEFGTNTTPELRNPSDGNTISGTVNGTIRTNEQRALSEYISYYDDPNEHDKPRLFSLWWNQNPDQWRYQFEIRI